MLTVTDTIYPRLKSRPSQAELKLLFTPTPEDILWVETTCQNLPNRLARLIHLVVTRHLHQPLMLKHIPKVLQRHVAERAGLQGSLSRLAAQGHDVPYLEHLRAVREHLRLISYRNYGPQELARVLQGCCTRHEDLVSILNASVETLHLQHFELPGFTTLVKVATTVRASINKAIFSQVIEKLGEKGCQQLDRLFEVEAKETTSKWNTLKLDPKKASLSQLRVILSQLEEVEKLSPPVNLKSLVSHSKFDQFVQEAKSLNRQAMVRLTVQKRYTLAVALLESRAARLRDDLGTVFVKRMFRLRTHALNLLRDLQEKHQGHTDVLIDQLRKVAVLLAAEDQEDVLKRVREAIPKPEDTLLEIDQYRGRTRNNFVPFMLRGYNSHRALLLNFLEGVTLTSTSDNKDLEHAIRYVLEHRSEKDPNLSTFSIDPRFEEVVIIPDVPLGWVPEMWRPFVFQHSGREVMVIDGHPLGLSKLYFELCVLLHLAWELKSGDMCIEGSEDFANYTLELVTDHELQAELPVFLQQMGLDETPGQMTRTLKAKLQDTSRWADLRLKSPGVTGTRIKGETFTLSKMEAEKEPEGFEEHRQRIVQGLHQSPLTVLDALFDTEHLVPFSKVFRPISGLEAKLTDPITRYVTTVFCYGCNLGATQAARSLPGTNRRDFEWVNQHHITETALQEATTLVVNAYQQFQLPKLWGSGEHASADGTKWEMFENNLMSEYHIRYGGYGGLGYYHVSDRYIALFSHFIPCGVWEAVYILDGMLQNTSDIQPDKLHADTQGQSAPVFGMAYLLGIELLPRIRNWQDLHFYRADKTDTFQTMGGLLRGNIDWELIETHLPDMLRIVVSIKRGRISAATVLKRLSSFNRKNKVYQAFKELGLAVRTIFLLRYIADPQLRSGISKETNKSEQFNNFVQWSFFGGEGIVQTNHRDHQRKLIKYNLLVANCLVFHTVYLLTKQIRELEARGQGVPEEVLKHLNPYWMGHLNRFGRYDWEVKRLPDPVVLNYKG